MKMLGLCSILLFFLHCQPVMAETTKYPDDEMQEVLDNFISLGIEQQTAETLLDKYKNGGVLDCMNEIYCDLRPNLVEQGEGFYREIYVYPDGSRKVISIMASSATISGGSYISGTNWYSWQNALVYTSNGLHQISFYANLSGSIGYGRVTSINNLSYSTGIQNNYFGIVTSEATASVPAKAGFRGQCNGRNVYLYVYSPIGGNAYAESNL